MKAARLRLLLAAVLFAGWIGWLAHMAFTVTNPVILSRAQLLVSDLDVVAQVDADPADEQNPSPTVKVEKVLWPEDQRAQSLGTLEVATLGRVSKQQGWRGPGRYIIPLQVLKTRGGSAGNKNTRKLPYQLARIPPSPGYSPHGSLGFIYLATPEALNQYEQIRAGNWE